MHHMKKILNLLMMILGFTLVLGSTIRADDTDILVRGFLAARTDKCWTLDRISRKNVVSAAATGFGFYAYAIAAERSLIQNAEASMWIRNGLEEMIRVNTGNHGWLYHFVDTMGNPIMTKSVSSVDTTIFYLGAEAAARRLRDKELLKLVQFYKSQVDVDYMFNSKTGQFRHGYILREGKPDYFIHEWDEYNEGVIIYKYFGKPFKPTAIKYGLPLFCYYYPLCFYDDKELVDHLGRAIDWQFDNMGKVGFTACDSPDGYAIMKPDVVSPLAVYTCNKYFPAKLRETLLNYKVSPLTQSMTLDGNWVSSDNILIDSGAALMILTQEK